MQAVQCKMARVALGLGIRELAEMAQVAPATISRLEAGEDLKPRTVDAIRQALESAGAIFVSENGEGPGVRLRKDSGAKSKA
jgi:transcriptional regulator with XRE-family HTH domain